MLYRTRRGHLPFGISTFMGKEVESNKIMVQTDEQGLQTKVVHSNNKKMNITYEVHLDNGVETRPFRVPIDS